MKITKFPYPYETTAKSDSYCSHCTCKIRIGDDVIFDKMHGKIYCNSCNAGIEILQKTKHRKGFKIH